MGAVTIACLVYGLVGIAALNLWVILAIWQEYKRRGECADPRIEEWGR